MHPAIFAVGITTICFSFLVFFLKRARYRLWIKASGTVVSLIEREDREGRGSTFAPQITFQTSTGQTIVFVSSASSFPAPGVGDSVTVLYDPNDPNDATLDAFVFKHAIELILFFMGTVAVVVYAYQRFAR